MSRHEKAMLAMKLGAPEGALTVPGHPIAYFDDTRHFVHTLYVHIWSPTGRFVCHTKIVPRRQGSDYSEPFSIGPLEVWYQHESRSLLPAGHPAPWFTPEQIEIRKAASQRFEAKHVTLPRQLHVGDRSETMRRYYAREQANALLRLMPPGYILVPEAQRTAYRVLDDGSIKLIKPTTDARHMLRGQEGALRFKTARRVRKTGLYVIERRAYRFDATKKILELVAQP
jgi:hypothetical protein